MTRLAPAFVSLLGSLGLGLALSYLVLVIRAFQPGADELVEFLIGSSDEEFGVGFLVVLIPYAFLMAHLWLRIRLGAWLLDRGEVELAERYAEKRLEPGLLRARKEAIAHRTVLVRIALRREDYEAALSICEAAEKLPRSGDELIDFRRWQLETALRREDLVAAHEIAEDVGVPRRRSAVAAAFCAAVAEIYVREGDRTEFDEWMRRAEFAHADEARLGVTRILAAARLGFGDDFAQFEAAEALLATAADYLADVPGATAEVLAAGGAVALLSEDRKAARTLLAAAADAEADARSQFVRGEVADELRDTSKEEE